MKISRVLSVILVFGCILSTLFFLYGFKNYENDIVTYTVDLNKADLKFYWKDKDGNIIRSLQNLKLLANENHQKLLFAMNGGMYQKDNSPQGLYIEDGKVISKLNTGSGNGNFHMKPNGVFYITTNNKAYISQTSDFKSKDIKYATQSGPMLVIDGLTHPVFQKGSKNLNIRNGVGILPDGNIIFAISKNEINFYDFAQYFKDAGCKNALYLDGFVSRAYIPEKNWIQTDGNFGVIIGVTEKLNKQ
ncbi:MAG: phosphodiester glycosidase family protein [Sporocytophaga sp.]|uniref:phosphodiester glycosidase family protein n=1 Tax=Sporocytophaga sp. TaxID=2231183 RepID=UPI001B175CCC|nr:phosphodiester glycosidase family protein [Sporocytophaga sp.]MBO9703543.1 phosphodiester glycosidase family protein [Sporocytophaga sp.]